jgi:hypothetical protein
VSGVFIISNVLNGNTKFGLRVSGPLFGPEAERQKAVVTSTTLFFIFA